MQDYTKHKLTIKTWAEADRPREKMLQRGRKQLTDAELLALLLGSGNREETAVGLAQRMLQDCDNNLHELGRRSLNDLCQYKGVGNAKAICIAAALELGRRRQSSGMQERPQITCSHDAFLILQPHLCDLPHEEFWILLLNRANRVIGRECISIGGVTGTVVDAKIIFRKAIEYAACSLILSHNHPSGNLKPSQADLDLTRKLSRGATHLDVVVLDHLILADAAYYSFADEGVL